MTDSNEFIDTIEKIQERLNKIDELLIISINDHVSVDDENNIIIEYDKINNHLLHSLELRNCNKLTDITPLSGLTNLDLRYCYELTDITQLTGLNNLTTLDLSGCSKLIDTTPLSELINLNIYR